MQNRFKDIIRLHDPSGVQFWVFAAIVLVSIFSGIISGNYFLAGLPALLLILYLGLVDFKLIFFLLLFSIPLSTEIYLPNGFGTDLPTEPLMAGLMLVYFLYVLSNGKALDNRFLMHPITLVLLLHFCWIIATTVTSIHPFVSVKYLLAKSWYVVAFYFMTGLVLKNTKDLNRYFLFVLVPLTITILITMIRHSATGFDFAYVHQVLNPFYRNHVAYASIMVVFFPFILLFRQWSEPGSFRRRLLTFLLFFYLVAIYLAFTRAAYVALFIAGGAYFIIRWRLTRYVLILTTIVVTIIVGLLAYNNRYLELAPNYERTVTHRNFENLLEATYQGEDISTMERVYRWVAGFYMSKERPVFGFGPGNFFPYYKSFTVKSFQTYVSDNIEQSGIHSYYLMVLVEQGYPGLFFFVLFIFYTLLKGENIYHYLKQPKDKQVVMTCLLSTIIILSLLIINDLIETDKIGSFFFINLAILVNIDLGDQTAAHDR